MTTVAKLHEESLETKGNRKKQRDGSTVVSRPACEPYMVEVTIEGIAPVLYHRYDPEAVAAAAGAKKGSKERKQDNVESFVYRDDKGAVCIPAEWMKAALANAGRKFQDPSSPRKSARDLVRAAILVGPYLATTGKKVWDALDVRGVVIQKNRVTRTRPMLMAGWSVKFEITVNDPEYIDDQFLYQLVQRAGSHNGLGDFRPDFGRFRIKQWEVRKQV